MIIMALDHVRDFFHADAMVFRPEDLARTHAALFFTRWITHFCAPVFFFLAGAGACLWVAREGRTTAALSRYLWTRGLWLIVLELTVLRFGFFFSLTEGPWLLTVLWALGLSMIGLALLCRLPVRVLAPLSLAVIALHNLLDPITARQLGPLAFVWNILHQPGAFFVGGTPVIVAYPLVPWVAVMAAGYCFASCYLRTAPRPDSPSAGCRLPVAGSACLLPFPFAFGVLGRLPHHRVRRAPRAQRLRRPIAMVHRHSRHRPAVVSQHHEVPAVAALPADDARTVACSRWRGSAGRPLARVEPAGRHRAGAAVLLPDALPAGARAGVPVRVGEVRARGLPGASDAVDGRIGGRVSARVSATSLATVYVVWVLVVLLTWPLCVWFARLKERRRDWWLGYL